MREADPMRTRSVTRSPATSAAVPATRRSSTRSRLPRVAARSRRGRERARHEQRPGPRRGAHERTAAARRHHRARDQQRCPRGAGDGCPDPGRDRECHVATQPRDRVRDPGLARRARRRRPPSPPHRSLTGTTTPTTMPVEPPVTSPRDLAEAYAILADGPARPIAGGTDLMVAITGELGEPPDRVLDLWRLDELRGIALDGDVVSIGALTTYTGIRRSAVCREHLPVLAEAAATIGAAQIQNRGTI